MRKRYGLPHFLVPLILLLMPLTACDQATFGSSSSGLSATQALTSSLPDPCSLLTPAEVMGALKQPIAEPTVDLELEDAECLYETRAAPGRLAVAVELTKVSQRNATFNERAQFFQNAGAKPIGDIGAAAYAHRGQILTQKPGIILFVIVDDGSSSDEALLQTARGLTRNVLSRLP